jgi:3-mercaptopyruvate sulfurtransferase SseA
MTRLLVLLFALFLTLSAETVLSPSDLVQPSAVAKELQSKATKPLVLFVGFPVLYRSAHIPGAITAGPCSTSEGLAKLKNAVADVPKDRDIVLYCGCCPMVKCPNVKPAYAALRAMGFLHVRVVELDTNFHTDWVQKGYPTERAH